MIAQMIRDGRGCVARERRADADECDPPLVVHDMNGVVLLDVGALHNTMVLEQIVDRDRDLDSPSLLAYELLYTCTAPIVEIVCVDRRLSARSLCAIHTHTIAVIP